MTGAKIAVLANCQSGPLSSLLGIAAPTIDAVRLPQVHTLNTEEKREAAANQIAGLDVLVHQPIGDRFGAVSISRLKERFPQKTFVSFPSIFFAGLSPQLSYIRKPAPAIPSPLGDYHDLRIVDAYLTGRTIEEAVKAVDLDDTDYWANFTESFDESTRREASLDIQVMPVIRGLMSSRQALYTFNHPCNEVLWHVVEQVLQLLSLPRDASAKPPQREYLSSLVAPVPRSVLDRLDAKWQSRNYVKDATVFPTEEITTTAFKYYDAEPDFRQTVADNRQRFGVFARDLGFG